MQDARPVLIRVVQGDVLEIKTDVLVLKYARHLFGADNEVYKQLISSGKTVRLPQEGNYTLLNSEGVLPAERILFVGVTNLTNFGYLNIRHFAKQALAILADETIEIRHLAITLHGPGYGLDEQESFESEIAGFVEALSLNCSPTSLEKISIVERSQGRANRLKKALAGLLPTGGKNWHLLSPVRIAADTALRTAGQFSSEKRHVFVAMPFVETMDDTFHYGIESAAKAAGMLCERADLSIFAGDIMDWVRRRIETAALVIADLTSANPNVYLELGYAWGCRIPTVLLSKEADDLKFDVRGQRCLIYKSIRQLEEKLTLELRTLVSSS